MNWDFKKRIVVSVWGNSKHSEYFITSAKFPVEHEKMAQDFYTDCLLKYPDADVRKETEDIIVNTKMGGFRISEDGEYAVSVGDDDFYYTLPEDVKSIPSIRNFLNSIYDYENE